MWVKLVSWHLAGRDQEHHFNLQFWHYLAHLLVVLPVRPVTFSITYKRFTNHKLPYFKTSPNRKPLTTPSHEREWLEAALCPFTSAGLCSSHCHWLYAIYRGHPCLRLAAIFAGMLYNVQIIQKSSTRNIMPGGGGALTYLAKRGCATLMGRFFTRNP